MSGAVYDERPTCFLVKGAIITMPILSPSLDEKIEGTKKTEEASSYWHRSTKQKRIALRDLKNRQALGIVSAKMLKADLWMAVEMVSRSHTKTGQRLVKGLKSSNLRFFAPWSFDCSRLVFSLPTLRSNKKSLLFSISFSSRPTFVSSYTNLFLLSSLYFEFLVHPALPHTFIIFFAFPLVVIIAHFILNTLKYFSNFHLNPKKMEKK
ncbi:hypothetical protein BpHYR1_014166 [Brachionus plicatilis]|uniref:Uncharacterized protein n=1 Tax=Brachionus plicatilis TaxID=10195 RepID=A0A3M7P826_BRAPC|nr:hypothetical protein BpHYR1_014166 [Brachionus plicatilis]